MALLEVRNALLHHQQYSNKAHTDCDAWYSGLNAAGEIASEATADASTWDGPVQIQQSDRIPVSAFAEQLQYEPEQELPGRESGLLCRLKNTRIFCLTFSCAACA